MRQPELPRKSFDEEVHLAESHDLVATIAYCLDREATTKIAAQAKSRGAERTRRCRAKAAENGFTNRKMPVPVHDAVTATGGWTDKVTETVLAAISSAATAATMEEKPAPSPPELSADDRIALDVGRRMQRLTGWRSLLMRVALAGAR
jgi:hypothetical protein